jgi:electron transport complex protein RnfG
MSETGAPDAALPATASVPAWRQMMTLGTAGSLAGLAIVLVFAWANPQIEAYRAEQLRLAIVEVLGAPERTATLFVLDEQLTGTLPAGVDSTDLDRLFVGFDAAGEPVGYAITGGKPGYQDVIRLIFGLDAANGQLLGMKVLESKETPGLGDKIEKDTDFVGSFVGAAVPILGVKAGDGTGDPHEIDMITGATISSRTVIEVINERLERFMPLLEAYAGGGE